jgi:hypothetical protein
MGISKSAVQLTAVLFEKRPAMRTAAHVWVVRFRTSKNESCGVFQARDQNLKEVSMREPCYQCRKKVINRHRMVIYSNRVFCCIECKEDYAENQRRLLRSELPLPSPAFGYIGVFDE